MEMIQYENPELISLLILLPLLVAVFLIYLHMRKRAIRKLGNEDAVRRILPFASPGRIKLKFILTLLALAFMTLAAINPQTGSRTEEAKREGVDIVVALDVSRSMLARDISPNRLERAKLATARLIDQLDQDRFGLVIFAGGAHTQIPLTADFRAARMLLQSVNTESVSLQGTSISRAIDRAVLAFGDNAERSRTIILVSDGESHEDDPLEASGRAAEKGITIHTIGIGSREGAPVPIVENGQIQGFLRDNDGNTVISRYDEDLMRGIASVSGGVFRHGSGADMSIGSIIEEIRQMEQQTYETRVFADYESRFYYFIAVALILLITELVLMERKNIWLMKLRIFK